MTDDEIDFIANDGCRNAVGGIYATRVYEFARAIRNAVLEEAAQSIVFLDEECTGPEMMLKAVRTIRALKTK